MKEIFDILDQKERKTLGLLSLLILLSIFFLFFMAIGEKKSYFQNLESLSNKKESHKKISIAEDKKESEWLRWQEARLDIDEIREKYLYKNNDIFQQVRVDLQKIFQQSRIHIFQIRYDYAELKTEGVKKVTVSFNLKGSYFSLKRFLNSIETFPKFLIVEKVDFLNIEAKGKGLELRISLAGYYES